jgi:hypothetical protein
MLNDSNIDGVMNDTTRESISVDDLDLTNDSLNLSDIDNVEEEDLSNNISENLSNDTTRESELSFDGGKKKRTRKNKILKKRKTYKKRNTRKTRKVHKKKSHRKRHTRKTRKMRRRKMSGGNVDSLGDADFNPNLAFDKKAIGGSKQYGGRNVGSNCFDPNFSIYNTRSLQLFPYKPQN